MEHHITVSFGRDQAYLFELVDADTADMTWEQARHWIDEEYVNTGCEAARRVGTAALTDKVVRIAMAYGAQTFAANTAWANKFARCTGRAIGKIKITIDIANQVVGL